MAADDAEDRPRHIVRGDDRPGASLAERLLRRLARLSWGTPLHRLRLHGRYPLQLLAAPEDPIAGNAAAGRALLAGRITLGDRSAPLDALDRPAELGPALSDHWQAFTWLRDLAAAGGRDVGGQTAEALTRRWLTAHSRAVTQPAWRPDLWGTRILMWAAHAPYILGGGDAALRKDLLNALARGARHLDRAADTAPQGLPRVTAWAGVVAAGLLVPGGDLRVAHGEAGLIRALGQALHADGGLISRAPVQQLILVELLVLLERLYAARDRTLPAAMARSLAQAVPPLLGTLLGDGALSSWQGGGPAPARRVATAVSSAGVRAEPLARVGDWGFQRLEREATIIVIDAAPPPVTALSLGGCASTLAFELSDGPERIIVNCGGGLDLPDRLVAGLRTTAAHSTLTIGDANSTALHADGALGRGVEEVVVERDDAGSAAVIEATHDGYARRRGVLHRRRLTLSADGRTLEGIDRLLPAGRRRIVVDAPVALRFHLAPAIQPVLTADGRGLLLRQKTGAAWQFRAIAGTVSLEDSLWIDSAGRPQPTQAILVATTTASDGVELGWSLRRVASR